MILISAEHPLKNISRHVAPMYIYTVCPEMGVFGQMLHWRNCCFGVTVHVLPINVYRVAHGELSLPCLPSAACLREVASAKAGIYYLPSVQNFGRRAEDGSETEGNHRHFSTVVHPSQVQDERIRCSGALNSCVSEIIRTQQTIVYFFNRQQPIPTPEKPVPTGSSCLHPTPHHKRTNA